jgi:acetolactate synthase-1/2/3 large subunit
MIIKVSDYISDFFVKKKMFHVFGITGGGAMHLNDSFGKNNKLKFIFFHHEQSAAMAADAFYRKNQKPCILHTTSGPGATNAITGVTGAWIDSIPMFVISGQVSTKDMIRHTKTRQIGVQEINIIDIVKPITKFSATIDDPEQIDIYLNKSYYSMFDSRPGPVWLDVPLDVQSKLIDTKKIKKFIKKDRNKKSKNTIVKILEKNIVKSSRPIIVIGNGIHISKSEKLFSIFLDRLNIPIISSWNASDIINSNHELYVGRMGIFGDRASNLAVEGADLIIVLGSRLSIPQTGYKTKSFAKKAKKIIIDISRAELNKNKFSKVILKKQIDLNIFLKKANKYFKRKKIKQFKEWINLLGYWKRKYPVMEKKYLKEKVGINSFHFIDTLSKSLKGNETIVTDMGASFTCTMQGFKIKNCNQQRLFTSSGLAAMGFGLPGAIGGYFGGKKNNIICITGDGGLMFNIQELQTVSHYKIPMKIFILENQGYLTMKIMQKKNFKRFVGSTKGSGISFPNFEKIAKTFNLKYFKLQKNLIENQIKKIINLSTPALIEVNMPPEQPLIPRTQNKLLADGTFYTPRLDDLYPHLSNSNLENERLKAIKIK